MLMLIQGRLWSWSRISPTATAIRCVSLWLGLVVGIELGAASGFADEPLRWKLEVGQRYKVALTQSSSTATEYETKSSNLATEAQMDLVWEVTAVEAGLATVSQRLERLALQLDLPTADGTAKVWFDSADKTASLNLKPEVQARLQALIGTGFEMKLRDNGEVESVAASPETLAAWQAAAVAGASRGRLSPQGLAALFSESSFPLPSDELAAGEGWSVSRETTGPWGQLQAITRYRLGGPQSYESRPALRIVMDRQVQPAASPQPAAVAAREVTLAEESKLRRQEASGEWFFDPAAGHLLGGKVVQRIEAERVYREETMKTVYRASSSIRMQRLD